MEDSLDPQAASPPPSELRALLETTAGGGDASRRVVDAAGRRIGPILADGAPRYELRARIGEGQQATVWAAEDRLLSSPERPARVAVKLFPPSTTPQAAARSLSEARAVGRLIHPNVVATLDAGISAEGEPFIVQMWVEARNLRAWLATGPRLAQDRALGILADASRGLAAIHGVGVAHGDVSPGNLLVGEDGRALLADFGCAAHGADRPDATGAPAFLPAEAWAGAGPSPAADLAALAGVAFWLFTGSLPYGESIAEIDAGHAHPEAALRRRAELWAKHRVDRGVVAAIEAALAPDPAARPRSAAQFAETLAALRARRRRIRRALAASGAGALLVALSILGAWWTMPARSATGGNGEGLTIPRLAALLGGRSDAAEGVLTLVGLRDRPVDPVALSATLAARGLPEPTTEPSLRNAITLGGCAAHALAGERERFLAWLPDALAAARAPGLTTPAEAEQLRLRLAALDALSVVEARRRGRLPATRLSVDEQARLDGALAAGRVEWQRPYATPVSRALVRLLDDSSWRSAGGG